MNKEAALSWGDMILTGINNVDIDTSTTGRIIVIGVGQGAGREPISQ